MKIKEMNSIKDFKNFYEDRYAHDYMEKWPEDKKERICEIIRSFMLPDRGDALDFGCGNGVFTSVLKKALPGWNIFGCDISEIAIENATKRIPDCKFFVTEDMEYRDKKFDFIFTHHVLEHVFDIRIAAQQIIERAHDNSSMLHILPCGNKGSFEYRICDLRIDGINQEMENRFFFEDEGHVRRMTTDSLVLLFKRFDFVLDKEFYSNQNYGALNLITRSHPALLFTMFNPLKGKNIKSKITLGLLLFKFLFIFMLRVPLMLYEKGTKAKNIVLMAVSLIPSRISKYFDEYFMSLSNREWQKCKTQKNGSEMYLYFIKHNE